MKKLISLILLSTFTFSVSKSQIVSDSCHIIVSDSCHIVDIYLDKSDTTQKDIILLEKKQQIELEPLCCVHNKTKINQNLSKNMENKEEKFFNKKRIIILTSLVALQVAFGFDPKFTAINLIWLLF